MKKLIFACMGLLMAFFASAQTYKVSVNFDENCIVEKAQNADAPNEPKPLELEHSQLAISKLILSEKASEFESENSRVMLRLATPKSENGDVNALIEWTCKVSKSESEIDGKARDSFKKRSNTIIAKLKLNKEYKIIDSPCGQNSMTIKIEKKEDVQ